MIVKRLLLILIQSLPNKVPVNIYPLVTHHVYIIQIILTCKKQRYGSEMLIATIFKIFGHSNMAWVEITPVTHTLYSVYSDMKKEQKYGLGGGDIHLKIFRHSQMSGDCPPGLIICTSKTRNVRFNKNKKIYVFF